MNLQLSNDYSSVADLLVSKGINIEDIGFVEKLMSSYYKRTQDLDIIDPKQIQSYRGRGNEKPEILIVSDMPDESEVRTGLIGYSSYTMFLLLMLKRLDITFEDLYITCALKKVYPKINMSLINQENKKLKKEIDCLLPSVIIALGTTAISSLANDPIRIEKAMGQEFFYEIPEPFADIPVIPIQHPNTIMTLETKEFKAKTNEMWQNIKRIGDLL